MTMKGRTLYRTVGVKQLYLMRSLGSNRERPAVRETEEDEIGQDRREEKERSSAGSINFNRKGLKTSQNLLSPTTAGPSYPRLTKPPTDVAQDNQLYTSDLLDINISKGEIVNLQPGAV